MKITVLIALCCTTVLACSCATNSSHKWDYYVVTPTTPNKEQIINQLGKEGWQLAEVDSAKGYLFRRAKK
jgi:hypothetical protein